MKLLFVLYGLSCVQAYFKRPCDSDEDCGRGQCCVSTILPRGKRAVLGSAGFCKNLGTDGDSCFVSPLQASAGVFYGSCPCSKGHTCDGTGLSTVPLGESGVCRPVPTPCSTSKDCRLSECCVSTVRPIGKRSVEGLLVNIPTGTCQPLGTNGASCLVSNGSGRPVDPVFLSCPCQDHLTCQDNGTADIPLGPLGTCESKHAFVKKNCS